MTAIIPARGGSKGLPRKNILPLCGKPLIAYTIEAALAAKSISRVIVSTDDQEIADVTLKFGAEVPALRPEILATDTASAVDVYLYEYEQNIHDSDSCFMVLLPTSPLRTSSDIDASVKQYHDTKARTLISMTETEIPPTWYYRVNENNIISSCGFEDNAAMRNRQEYTQYYRPNGAIYILEYALLKNQRSYYCDKTVAYIMQRERSIDIDCELDFLIAQTILSNSTGS